MHPFPIQWEDWKKNSSPESNASLERIPEMGLFQESLGISPRRHSRKRLLFWQKFSLNTEFWNRTSVLIKTAGTTLSN